MIYLTPRSCWLLSLTLFVLSLILLLLLTDLNIGFVYAISYGIFTLTLFLTAAHAVATIDRARTPTLRPR